jgi:hypothetical protein
MTSDAPLSAIARPPNHPGDASCKKVSPDASPGWPPWPVRENRSPPLHRVLREPPSPPPPAPGSPAGDLPKEEQGPRGACLPAKGASTLPAPGGQFGARSTLLCRIAKNEALSRNGARLNVGY